MKEMKMTREQFMELFDLSEENMQDYMYDIVEDKKTWWELAKEEIATMQLLLAD